MNPGTLLLGTALGFAAGVGVSFMVAICMAGAMADEEARLSHESRSLDRARAPRVIGMTDAELALWAERHGRAN